VSLFERQPLPRAKQEIKRSGDKEVRGGAEQPGQRTF
jgi:hypothetical protein